MSRMPSRRVPYLWLSTQIAAGESGLAPEARVNPGLPWHSSPIKLQTEYVLKNADGGPST